MKTTESLRLCVNVGWLGLALAVNSLRAQPVLEQTVFTAGTTMTDSLGQHWAYLLWHGATPTIYAKPGDANSNQPYVRKAVVGLQTDPFALGGVISRAASLGHYPATLESALDSMFDQLPPAASVGLPQKLSAAIAGAAGDPQRFEQLKFLARLHPAAAMALGLGHAERIEGPVGAKTTFELRTYDKTNDTDITVMARVTVTAGMPLALPAPERPVEIPDSSAKGDLNVKLRWATPDNLRRITIASHGFNIYRMTEAFAVANNYHIVPPTPTQLSQLVQQQFAIVQRLNQTPVLPEQAFDAVGAADLVADPTTYFFSDANDRFDPASPLAQVPFVNGSRFYYFATARDILGRDGLVSRGTLVTICDRMPPPAPRYVRVEVAYDYTEGTNTSEQRFRINWEQNDNSAGDTTVNYYIYRWSGLPEMHALAGNPLAHRVAGPIPHVVGLKENSTIDLQPGAPEVATHAGQTIWYTVRAEDAGACGPNLSGNSSPAWGVLRDRVGPQGGGGGIRLRCTTPTVAFQSPTTQSPIRDPFPGRYYFDLRCSATPGIRWADFEWRPTGGTYQLLARRYFAPGQTEVQFPAALSQAAFTAGQVPQFRCRVGAHNGKVSGYAFSGDVTLPTSTSIRTRVNFAAKLVVQPFSFSPTNTARPLCTTHDPLTPDDGGAPDGQIHPLILEFVPPLGAEEWRLYRRVDDGPQTLIAQGDGEFDGVEVVSEKDNGMPANASKLCYFVQFLDEHGNPGPVIQLGCVETQGTTPLPVPVLQPILAEGTAEDPKMRLQWFCAPEGVERFEVWIGGAPLAPGSDLSSDLTPGEAPDAGLLLDEQFNEPVVWRRYRTRRIGPLLGEGPLFSILANSIGNNQFRIFIRAVGKDDVAGGASNVEEFLWHIPSPPSLDVPWPARDLPIVNDENYPQVFARTLQISSFQGLAVRIGELSFMLPTTPPDSLSHFIPANVNPFNAVYRSPADEPLFDAVLYRRQMPNVTFPQVSGDLIQVSPLMESIAYSSTNAPGFGQGVLIRDPFIRMVQEPTPAEPQRRSLYLVDTQPVLEGASYRYLLVRFSKLTHEPVEVIPTNDVLVP